MKLNILRAAVAALCILALAGCSKDNGSDKKLELASTSPAVTLHSSTEADIALTSVGGSIPFTVGRVSGWEAVVQPEADSWCSVYQVNDKLSIAVDEFISDQEDSRTGTVEVNADGSVKAVIRITQSASAKATLQLEPEGKAYISCKGGEIRVNVQSNVPSFNAEITGMDLRWAECSTEGNTVIIKAGKNITGKERSAVLKVSVLSGSDEVVEEYEFRQGDGALTMEYVIQEDGRIADLPVTGDIDCTVDWGDGSEPVLLKGWVSSYSRPSHSYDKAGTYTVSVSGSIEELNCDDSKVQAYLSAFKSWGAVQIKSLKKAFKGTTLTEVPAPEEPALFAEVKSVANAFEKAASLKTVPEDFFSTAVNVTDASSLFSNCKALESVPEGLFRSMPLLTSVSSMFYNCQSLKSVPEDLFKSCTEITSANALFQDSALESIPAGFFSFGGKVQNMMTVFSGCANLKSVPEGLFDSLVEATRFQSTFVNCKALTSVPANLLDRCRKISITMYMFSGCSSLEGESPYTMVDGKKVHLYERSAYPDSFTKILDKDAKGTFSGCTKLTDYGTMPAKYKE